jgi:hypothetical protein
LLQNAFQLQCAWMNFVSSNYPVKLRTETVPCPMA